MKSAWLGLLVTASTVAGMGCDNEAKDCNQFFDVAAPIVSSIAVPSVAPSGSAAVAWAHDVSKHYSQLAQEAEKAAARTSDGELKSVLQNETNAAATVAEQLERLAEAVAGVKSSEIPPIKTSLESAAQAERTAARALEQYCTK
jgi:hypothetical protein